MRARFGNFYGKTSQNLTSVIGHLCRQIEVLILLVSKQLHTDNIYDAIIKTGKTLALISTLHNRKAVSFI